MERKVLLEKLETVEAALAQQTVIPVCANFWFTGEHLLAYNDHIAISTPLQTDFKGAAAPTLLELLKNHSSKHIELTPVGNDLRAKYGKSFFQVGLMAPEAFIFQMPKFDQEAVVFDAAGHTTFLTAIKDCLRSVGTDASVIEQVGLTLQPKGKNLEIYATNDDTVAYAVVPMVKPLAERIILSQKFCSELLSLSNRGTTKLHFKSDHVMAKGPDGVYLYGRLLFSPRPLDYHGIMQHHIPELLNGGLTKARKTMIDLSHKQMHRLRLIIKRQGIIASSRLESVNTVVSVENGILTMSTKSSERGQAFDQVKLLDNHPNAKAKLNPSHLEVGFEGADRMAITERCAVFVKPNHSVFLISVAS